MFVFFFFNRTPRKRKRMNEKKRENKKMEKERKIQSEETSKKSVKEKNVEKEKSSDKPHSSKNDDAPTRTYSDEAGHAIFFNYLNGCEPDIERLKARLQNYGYPCTDLTNVPRKSWNVEFGNNKNSQTLLVFFYGYGYEERMVLESSSTESLSYDMFYGELKKLQKRGDALVVFSNLCFKSWHSGITEMDETSQLIRDIFHFNVRINGNCQAGSLLTEHLLNEKKGKKIDIDFSHLTKYLTGKMHAKKWGGGKYFCSASYIGTIDDINLPMFFPQVSLAPTDRRAGGQTDGRAGGQAKRKKISLH